MKLNSIRTVAAALCLAFGSVGAPAVTTAAPIPVRTAWSAQDPDAARRELEKSKADLQAEREARTTAEAGRDKAREGSRVFLALSLLLATLAVVAVALLVSAIKIKRPKWLHAVFSGGGDQPPSAPDADKSRRAAQTKLDEWLRLLARELDANPGSDAAEDAEEARDQDRGALRRASEPGLGAPARAPASPASPVPVGTSFPRPTVPIGQPPVSTPAPQAAATSEIGSEQVRESTALIMRLAAAAQQAVDSSNHVSRLEAAESLLRAVSSLAPSRSRRSAERRGPEAAGCVELARAAVELTQAWALNDRLDRAKSTSGLASSFFANALTWLPDKDDIHVHIEQAQLHVVRAVMEKDEQQRAARLGEALSEVHSAQRKNRGDSTASAGGLTASPRVDDARLESRLMELALRIRLDALGVPSLKDLSRSGFQRDPSARLRPEVVLPLAVAQPEPPSSTLRSQSSTDGHLKLTLAAVEAWAAEASDPERPLASARPMYSSAIPVSSSRSLAWNILRLRLEVCMSSGSLGESVATFTRPMTTSEPLEGNFGGGDLGFSQVGYKDALYEAVNPSHPADPREPGLASADVAAVRHHRLLRLTDRFGSGSVASSYTPQDPSSVLTPQYATAVEYFASLVKCRGEGRAAPSSEILRTIWRDALDAGLNDRTGLFEGRQKQHADACRRSPDFLAQYWTGLCFYKAPSPPRPPEEAVGDGRSSPAPAGTLVNCVLLPIRAKDAGGKDVVRGLRLIDLGTAYRPGDLAAQNRATTRRDGIKESLAGRRVVIQAGGPGQLLPLRRKGIFGLELSPYQVETHLEDKDIELESSVRVNCLQIAELRFDLIEPIDGAVRLQVEVLNSPFQDIPTRGVDSTVGAASWFSRPSSTFHGGEPVDGTPPATVLCSCELDSRPWAIVPEPAPIRVAPWGHAQIHEVLPFYTQLLMYLAGDLDQSVIRSELSAALRSLHEQFGAAKEGNADLEFQDEMLGFVAYQAMRMAGWRHRKQGIDREWQWILAQMPAAVEPFIRLLQLDGNQTLLGVALRNGIKAPDQPVQVSIQQPLPGAVYREGAAVLLQASAKAMDGANLSASIKWSSRSQGELGAGASLSISTLRAGRHSLVATAVDASGRQGVAEVSIDVGDAGWTAQPQNPAVPPVGIPWPRQVGGSLPQRVAEYYGLAGSFITPPAWSSPPTPQQRKHLEGLVRSAQSQLQANPSAFEQGRQLLAEIARASA